MLIVQIEQAYKRDLWAIVYCWTYIWKSYLPCLAKQPFPAGGDMDNAWFLSCSQPLNTSHPTQLTAEEKREHVEEQERCSKKYNAASKTWRAAEVKWKRDHTAWKAEFRRVFLTHFAQNATPWPPPSILSNLVSKLQDIESW